jgi:hypothetical protein
MFRREGIELNANRGRGQTYEVVRYQLSWLLVLCGSTRATNQHDDIRQLALAPFCETKPTTPSTSTSTK